MARGTRGPHRRRRQRAIALPTRAHYPHPLVPPETLASFAITAALLAGVACRRRRRVHVPIMCGVILADLALLLVVETRARAVERVVAGVPGTVWLHVAIAVACLVAYGVAVVTGTLLLRGREAVRRVHRGNALAAVCLRLAVLATTPGLLLPALPEAR